MFRSLLSLAAVALLATPTLAADVCNGHAELCSKLYSQVTFLGAHNSYAVGDGIADNQNKNVTAQLDDGIRTLQIQAHNLSGNIQLCHSSCSFQNGGTMEDYLTQVQTWVTAHPTEVITLVIVNMDDIPATTFDSILQSTGISSHAYTPDSASLTLNQWPTLGSLIDSGKNVVVFMNYKADFASVPYIIDEFSNMWEDAYDVTSVGWECAVNRSSGNSGQMMFMVNHFLDDTYNLAGQQLFVPKKNALNVTNSVDSLGIHVGNCNSIWGRNPNHILVDFYDSNGNVPFDYVAQLNGVASPTNTVVPAATSASAVANTAAAAFGSQTAKITTSPNAARSSRGDLALSQWALGLGVGALGMVVGGTRLWL